MVKSKVREMGEKGFKYAIEADIVNKCHQNFSFILLSANSKDQRLFEQLLISNSVCFFNYIFLYM
jgi:hypothetical protein